MTSNTITAESLAAQVLNAAGVPTANMTLDKDELPFCDRAGYLITDSTSKSVNVAIIGDSSLEESARSAGRDGLTQQARAALDNSGWTVKVNEFGHIFAKMPRLLSCGLCFEENGEEVHPHPECPVVSSASEMPLPHYMDDPLMDDERPKHILGLAIDPAESARRGYDVYAAECSGGDWTDGRLYDEHGHQETFEGHMQDVQRKIHSPKEG